MQYYKNEIEIKGTTVTILETGEVIQILDGTKAEVVNKEGNLVTAYENKPNGWMLFFNDEGLNPILSRWTIPKASADIQALL